MAENNNVNQNNITAGTPLGLQLSDEEWQNIAKRLDNISVSMHQSDDYLQNKMVSDITRYQRYAQCKTGYMGVDYHQRFYPGLYCLGGVSSLGKTTWAAQLADQQAAMGRYVLYFSLEQSPLEIYSKGITRKMICNKIIKDGGNPSIPDDAKKYTGFVAQNAPVTGDFLKKINSANIRNGVIPVEYPTEYAQAVADYTQMLGNRLTVYSGAFALSVEDINALVYAAVRSLQAAGIYDAPVVIIDYLQIIAPSSVRMDTKAAVDHIVHSLKVMQLKTDATVILVSSFNRQNYLTPVGFESFKESGGIEYTADVIWGLQLQLLEHDSFYVYKSQGGKEKGRETSLKEKREQVDRAKAAHPRNISLVCLKNRFGQPVYNVKMDYYAQFEYFVGL